MGFYTDSSCSNAVSSWTATEGDSSKTFYFSSGNKDWGLSFDAGDYSSSSSNTTVATVSGVSKQSTYVMKVTVAFKSAGSATISVTSEADSGSNASLSVTVEEKETPVDPPVTNYTISVSPTSATTSRRADFTVTTTPDNGTFNVSVESDPNGVWDGWMQGETAEGKPDGIFAAFVTGGQGVVKIKVFHTADSSKYKIVTITSSSGGTGGGGEGDTPLDSLEWITGSLTLKLGETKTAQFSYSPDIEFDRFSIDTDSMPGKILASNLTKVSSGVGSVDITGRIAGSEGVLVSATNGELTEDVRLRVTILDEIDGSIKATPTARYVSQGSGWTYFTVTASDDWDVTVTRQDVPNVGVFRKISSTRAGFFPGALGSMDARAYLTKYDSTIEGAYAEMEAQSLPNGQFGSTLNPVKRVSGSFRSYLAGVIYVQTGTAFNLTSTSDYTFTVSNPSDATSVGLTASNGSISGTVRKSTDSSYVKLMLNVTVADPALSFISWIEVHPIDPRIDCIVTVSGKRDVFVGDSETYTATVTPSTVVDKTVNWYVRATSSSDPLEGFMISSQTGTACTVRFTKSGSYTVTGTSSVDSDSQGHVYVRVVARPAEPGKTNCWLNVTTEDGSKTLDMPIVTQFSDSYTANLTEYSTLVYGYRNRFIADMGVSERISLKVERANPPDYDDSSQDSQKWSNGRWYHELEDMLDFWQNFGRDMGSAEWTGGLRLHYEPTAECRELFPVFDKNVFMTGTINVNHSNVQKLSLTLPFVVGRMTSKGSTVAVVTVRFTDGSQYFENTYPANTWQVMPMPKPSWESQYADDRYFSHWVSESGTVAYAGQLVEPGTSVWTAQWKLPLSEGRMISAIDGSTGTVTVPDGATRMVVYATAGGGSGGVGGCLSTGQSGDTQDYWMAGGAGGGAGECVLGKTFYVVPGDIITYSVGFGASGVKPISVGAGGYTGGKAGNNGGRTVISRNEKAILTLEGGYGGGTAQGNTVISWGSAMPIVPGGSGSYSGGDAAKGNWTSIVSILNTIVGSDGASSNGSAGAGSISILESHIKYYATRNSYCQGSGGGGSPGIERTFTKDGQSVYISSAGGNAGSDADGSAGRYGGGGGGCSHNIDSSSTSGAGGDGFVSIIFYGES